MPSNKSIQFPLITMATPINTLPYYNFLHFSLLSVFYILHTNITVAMTPVPVIVTAHLFKFPTMFSPAFRLSQQFNYCIAVATVWIHPDVVICRGLPVRIFSEAWCHCHLPARRMSTVARWTTERRTHPGTSPCHPCLRFDLQASRLASSIPRRGLHLQLMYEDSLQQPRQV